MIKLDDILKDIGEFGPYQRRVFAIVCAFVFTSSWQSMITVFLTASVDHWCSVPEWDDFDCGAAGLGLWECEQAKRSASIPHNYTSDGRQIVYEKCQKFNVSSEPFWPGLDPSNYTTGSIDCDHGWVYDRSQYKSSIVMDFDLVCGKGDLRQISQSVFFGGYLAGSIINGSIADWFGRWWTLFFCMVIRLIAGIALAFAPTWWFFTLARFFQGYAAISIYVLSFVIGMEFVGPSKRNIAGIAIALPFAFGYMSLALIAYFVRYWTTLQLIATSPAIIYLGVMFLLPESVRWQISVGKYEKAEKTISKIATANKKVILSGPIFDSNFQKAKESEPKERRASGLDLFRTPRMRIRSINLIVNWMVNAMVYHGLSLNTSNLGVNDYVAFAVSGGVEIPAYLLSLFIIQYIGRRISLCGCLLLGGAACLCTTFIPPGAALTTVAMIGKFAIAASFAVLYLYTAELYPTSIRSAGMGTCSMFSRIAGILAPIILTLSKFWTPLPLVIYGSASVVAGLLTLLLPETLGHKLPETLEEGENFGMSATDQREDESGVYMLNPRSHEAQRVNGEREEKETDA